VRLEPTLQQVLEKYPKEVKLVMKHLPLPSMRLRKKPRWPHWQQEGKGILGIQ